MGTLVHGRVQPCGCIALPEDLQLSTGLNPGATYQLQLTAEGSLLLIPLETQPRTAPALGAHCG